jgi:hypothetical protein
MSTAGRERLREARARAVDKLYAVFANDVVLEAEVEAILAEILAHDRPSGSVGPHPFQPGGLLSTTCAREDCLQAPAAKIHLSGPEWTAWEKKCDEWLSGSSDPAYCDRADCIRQDRYHDGEHELGSSDPHQHDPYLADRCEGCRALRDSPGSSDPEADA